MLTTFRRGPASISRSLSIISKPFYTVTASASYLLPQPRHLSHNWTTLRPLHASSQWKRPASAAAIAEDESYEGGEPVSKPNTQASSPTKLPKYGPVTRFAELAERGLVCRTVVDTITKDMGLETMTEVQCKTINETLKGIDTVAQARTGTGKTLAFLIPILQNIIKHDPSLERNARGRRAAPDIRAIIISPTRELAEQIAVEARKVVRNTGVAVQTAVGGSHKASGMMKIKREGCHILVGTPGRLNDILSDSYSGIQAPNLSALVLDEADRLLDQGFLTEIKNIQSYLPDRQELDRQTLLFSATIPKEIMSIVRETMKPDFVFVQTVQPGEQQTHQRVPQKLVNVAGFENTMPALVELCTREIKRSDRDLPFKAIVYLNATAEVTLAASTLKNLQQPGGTRFGQHPWSPTRIIEMHGKLSQNERTAAADDFRRSKNAILVSSDVTARGMDFPNVTHVIQLGIPVNRDSYIHRIGRTARGDKNGEGWLILTPLERNLVQSRLAKLPLQLDDSLQTAQVNMKEDAQLPANVAEVLTQVAAATRSVPMRVKMNAYVACLGIYTPINKQDAVDLMNDRCKFGWGLKSPPRINPALVSRLGLGRVSGIELENFPDRLNSHRGGQRSAFDRDDAEPSSRGFGSGQGSWGGNSQGREGRGYNSSSSFPRDGRGSFSSGYGGGRDTPAGRGRGMGNPYQSRNGDSYSGRNSDSGHGFLNDD